MGPPLLELAMKLLFLQILALTVEVVFNLTPDEDQVAPALKVAHYDCSEMTENTLYTMIIAALIILLQELQAIL